MISSSAQQKYVVYLGGLKLCLKIGITYRDFALILHQGTGYGRCLSTGLPPTVQDKLSFCSSVKSLFQKQSHLHVLLEPLCNLWMLRVSVELLS